MINTNYKGKPNICKQINNDINKLKPREVIELVKDSISLEAGLDRYLGINLAAAKGGKTKLIPCPFHQEKTASFAVTPSENKFHCFGCHVKGDVITLVSLVKGVSQARAAYLIADDYALIMKDCKGNKKFQNAKEIKRKVINIEQERDLLQRENEMFMILADIEKNIINPLLNKPKSVEEMERISKLYHLKAEFAFFLDLLTDTAGADPVDRELSLLDMQEWASKKIIPVIKLSQGVKTWGTL